jgi:Flp pilus assembly secretin CpaC
MILRTLLAAVALAATTAAHAERIVLEADKTVMVSMADKPGTVVVGNPSIADASINGNTIFLHGRGYGNTNLIVLDSKGGQLANFDVTIKQAQADAVTFYTVRPSVVPDQTIRISYSCSPTCEPTLQPGDFGGQFDLILKEQKSKSQIASGSESSEAEAPSAAQ